MLDLLPASADVRDQAGHRDEPAPPGAGRDAIVGIHYQNGKPGPSEQGNGRQ
jgi:hypothetical protein